MKKSLALLAITALLVGTSGCGCCRGLFGKSRNTVAAVPLNAQFAPCCNSCNSGLCTTGGCADGSCGCSTGAPVTYGFDGTSGAVLQGVPAGTVIEGSPTFAPATGPAGSGSVGSASR